MVLVLVGVSATLYHLGPIALTEPHDVQTQTEYGDFVDGVERALQPRLRGRTL